MEFTIRNCNKDQLEEILYIYNDAILHSTALYDYKTRTMETMYTWYEDKLKGNYPVIGAFDKDHKLLGFATYGQFRVRPAYKYTIEHSVYIHPEQRGHGLGSILLNEIIQRAKEQNYHVMVGVIDTDNQVSLHLHRQAGFKECGIIKQSGYKFGRWLDAAFYQLILDTPESPTED